MQLHIHWVLISNSLRKRSDWFTAGLNSDSISYENLSKEKYRLSTGIYSARSMLSYYLDHSIGTNQGPSLEQIKKLSLEGISGIVTRHPIYRLISSWNDKFRYVQCNIFPKYYFGNVTFLILVITAPEVRVYAME